MRLVAEFLLALADLVEAEGQALKRNVVKVMTACALLTASLGLLWASLALVVYGFYLAVIPAVAQPWATFITGGVTLLISGGIIAFARWYVK